MENIQILFFLFISLIVSLTHAGLSFSNKDGGYLQNLDYKGDFNFYSYIKEFGQFEYKNTDGNVQFGCYGFIEPLFNKLKTTFYVADAAGTRNFKPFSDIVVFQEKNQPEMKSWDQLPLPDNCRLKEILNPTPPPRLGDRESSPPNSAQNGLFGNSLDELTANCPCLEVDTDDKKPTVNNIAQTYTTPSGDKIPVLFVPYCAGDTAGVGQIDQATLKKFFENSLPVPYKCSRCSKK